MKNYEQQKIEKANQIARLFPDQDQAREMVLDYASKLEARRGYSLTTRSQEIILADLDQLHTSHITLVLKRLKHNTPTTTGILENDLEARLDPTILPREMPEGCSQTRYLTSPQIDNLR